MLLNLYHIVPYVILIWCIKDTNSKIFRGFTKSCSGNTPECLKNFAETALTSFLEGIPELDIEPLDPFVFENVQLNLPGGLKVEFLEGQSSGFKKCIVESVRSIHDKEYEVILRCNLTMEGKYRSVGRMLLFPVNGEGESTITCNNITIKLRFELVSDIASDGRKHLSIEKFNSKHTFEGQVHYNLTNIFKGNPELSDVVLNFMNSNWRMVAEEFGNPIVNYGISAILKNVKRLFKLVPSDDFIPI